MNIYFRALIVVVLCIFLSACAGSYVAKDAEDILIGQSAPVTGPIADIGNDMVLGAKI